jgi:hypothetical protein
MDPGAVLVLSVLIVSIAGTVVLRGPLGRAFAERISGKSSGSDERVQELSEVIVGELEEVKDRITELEERQEFSDRLLDQVRRSELGSGE